MTRLEGQLRAGAAQMEITPRRGTQIAGDIGRWRPAEMVLDPIYARALVLEQGGRQLCLVSLDVLGVTTEWAEEIRRGAMGLGIAHDAVMVHDIQSHSAPAIGHFMLSERTPYVPPELAWLRGGDEEYAAWAVERTVEAIRRAQAALQPVYVGAASGLESRIAFNRRFVMRDGKVATHPATGSPLIRYAEGPIDPEVGVVCFNTEDLRTVALLLHYTCHPCHGYPYRYISADWPGAWCEQMRTALGPACVPLVINGCCGNIHHNNHLDPTYVSDHRRMGQILAQVTEQVLKRITFQRDIALDWKSVHIRIPLREPSAEDIEAARQYLAQYPEPKWTDQAHTALDWDWFFAVALLDLWDQRQHDPLFDVEIQAFRIGDIAIVGVPGEPFVEGQLRIKLESPTYPTYVAHHCNTYVGYVPTKEAFGRGGYETRSCNSSKLVPEALDRMVDAAGQLLRELFRQGKEK